MRSAAFELDPRRVSNAPVIISNSAAFWLESFINLIAPKAAMAPAAATRPAPSFRPEPASLPSRRFKLLADLPIAARPRSAAEESNPTLILNPLEAMPD